MPFFPVLKKWFLVIVLLATWVLELHFAVTGLLVTTLTGPFLPMFTVTGTTEGSRVTRQILMYEKWFSYKFK